MPRRDARLEAVARRLGVQARAYVPTGTTTATVADAVEQIVTDAVLVTLRAERARARRIVRRVGAQ